MGSDERGVRVARIARLVLLVLLLGPLLALKLSFDPLPAGHSREDSTLFYLVARSVADGDGLRTNVSLYHQGLRDMPARSPLYPLWPLLLGGAGRIVGLERAAALLPDALYLIDLLSSTRWGTGSRRSSGARGRSRGAGLPGSTSAISRCSCSGRTRCSSRAPPSA